VKVTVMTATTHNPSDESHTGELLEGKPPEQFLWGGAGNGPQGTAPVPYPTAVFKAPKQNLKIKTFVGTTSNAVKTQVWTALITMLMLRFMQLKSQGAVALELGGAAAHELVHASRPLGLAQQSAGRASRSWSAAAGSDEVLTWTAYRGPGFARLKNPSNNPGKTVTPMLDLR
jgi:hypothetical protein